MSREFPRTASALRSILQQHGVRPRRSKGQHFLTDVQAVDAIVRDAGVGPGDRVIEVGTGLGLLTHALVEAGAERVVTFEVDEAMLRIAHSMRDWPDHVRFVECDVLARKRELAPVFRDALLDRPAPPGRLLFVSNLPYGAGTPIVLGVLALARPPDELVVMLQEEVVEKFLAAPGSADYGVPSVAVGLKADGRIVRRFGPEVFWPRPRVRSATVRLVPRPTVPLAPEEHRPFGDFVTALFSRRRKILPSALRHAAPGLDGTRARDLVAGAGLAETVRVGEVAPATLLDLWRRATGDGGGG